MARKRRDHNLVLDHTLLKMAVRGLGSLDALQKSKQDSALRLAVATVKIPMALHNIAMGKTPPDSPKKQKVAQPKAVALSALVQKLASTNEVLRTTLSRLEQRVTNVSEPASPMLQTNEPPMPIPAKPPSPTPVPAKSAPGWAFSTGSGLPVLVPRTAEPTSTELPKSLAEESMDDVSWLKATMLKRTHLHSEEPTVPPTTQPAVQETKPPVVEAKPGVLQRTFLAAPSSPPHAWQAKPSATLERAGLCSPRPASTPSSPFLETNTSAAPRTPPSASSDRSKF